MEQSKKRPLVAVVVAIRKEGKVLVGKRIGSHGNGTWGFPGGHLEFGETIFNCAEREVFEETGLRIHNLVLGPVTEDYVGEGGMHYVTVCVICDYLSGTPAVLEPEYNTEWTWYDWNEVPQPLFSPLLNLKKYHFDPQSFI